MYANRYGDGALLNVWIQTRSSKTAITGFHGDSVKIAVKAPPVEGRANEECIELLSGILGLPKRQLAIKSGQHSRRKSIVIKGIAPEKVEEYLVNALEGHSV